MTEPSELRGAIELLKNTTPISLAYCMDSRTGDFPRNTWLDGRDDVIHILEKLLAPSELRGDVISREAAIEALEFVRSEWGDILPGARGLWVEILGTIKSLAPSVPEPPNDAERSVIREFKFTTTPTGMNVTPIVGRGLVTRCIFDGAHLGTWNIEGDGMTFTFNDSLSSAPTGLTRERLDEMIKEAREEIGREGYKMDEAFRFFWRGTEKLRDKILAILESSSAPTPETEE